MQDFYLGKSQKSFSITFMTCNRETKKGGQIITIARAQKTGLKNAPGNKFLIGIYCHDTGKRYPVHERLIFKLNGQEIYW